MAGPGSGWRGGERGCSRWALYAGAAAVVLLFLFLLVSARFVERGLNAVALRAERRVLERLPLDLPTAQRARTERNLERLTERLRGEQGGSALASSFLGRVGAALEDDRLTAAELEELNRFLEAPAGAPGG